MRLQGKIAGREAWFAGLAPGRCVREARVDSGRRSLGSEGPGSARDAAAAALVRDGRTAAREDW